MAGRGGASPEAERGAGAGGTRLTALHPRPAESSLPGVEAQVPALRNYLWSRRVPVEPEELQRRARRLEERLLEDAGGACRRVGRTEGPRPAERGPPLPLPLPGAPGRDGLRLCSGNAAP